MQLKLQGLFEETALVAAPPRALESPRDFPSGMNPMTNSRNCTCPRDFAMQPSI